MAARPLLRSALSLNFFTSGSEYLDSTWRTSVRASGAAQRSKHNSREVRGDGGGSGGK